MNAVEHRPTAVAATGPSPHMSQVGIAGVTAPSVISRAAQP
ncbi:hypothetical protein ACFC8N_32185 [Streptomyces sp. NPDC055966]